MIYLLDDGLLRLGYFLEATAGAYETDALYRL